MKYIFVDVDGVLNPDVLRDGGFKYLALPNGDEYPGYYLNLHPDYGKWLLDLAKSTESELVWGTTWQSHANKWIGSKLNLPEIPNLDLTKGRFSESLGGTKARAALEYAGSSRFVYFDDEPDMHFYFKDQSGLHIYIEPRYGLQPEHIQEAEQYLNQS